MAYLRYFDMKDGPTAQRLAELIALRDIYMAALNVIKNEIGADNIYTYQQGGRLCCFKFSKNPGPDFKKMESGFLPKKTTKSGKVLAERIAAIPVPPSVHSCLEVVGMGDGHWCLQDGLTIYNASICGSPKAGWFAVIPWMDVDPKVLEQYRKDREAGTHGNGNYDHLLWTAPAEWVEVKEWEMKKAMDDARAA